MRFTIPLLLTTVCAATLPAQQFFIPDSDTTTGNCNIFPFGGTGGQNIKYQTLVTAAELGNHAGLITGMGFAQCGEGVHYFGALEIVLAHTTATTLSTNFVANLGSNPVTVLSTGVYEWNLTVNSWQEVGLTNYFPHDGTSNLLVQVTAYSSVWTATGVGGSPGMRTASRQRLYVANWSPSPPATGTFSATNALKMEIDFGVAKVSSYGHGCAGSNGQTPKMAVTGLPHLGATVGFELSGALSTTIGMSVMALDNSPPFPADLAIVGMPGCVLYQDLYFVSFLLTNAQGGASLPLTVPNSTSVIGTRFYAQWGCNDPTANAFGWTTSNHVRVQVGT